MTDYGPASFVLFGATGDLAVRKIMPALCALYAGGTLSADSQVIAFSRRPWGNDEYRAFIRPALAARAPDEAEKFLARVEYVQGTFDDPASYAALAARVQGRRAYFHLAIQPEFYSTVVHALGGAGLRGALLVEKPFGQDQASAQALEADVERYFRAEDVYRIDHYLGKAGLDAFVRRRRRDAQFEASLSGAHVASVTCSLLEPRGVEERGEFYDATGALRDVGQNHVLEMLATALMDMPADSQDTPQARAAALRSLACVGAERGQYEGYAHEPHVRPGSQTETYFKIAAASGAARWQGTACVLEAGKGMRAKKSAIDIVYKNGAHESFPMDTPGAREAYETVIGSALRGDDSHAAGSEEMLAAWAFADGAKQMMEQSPLHTYPKGGDGPAQG